MKIHIFSIENEISNLIRKAFSSERFLISYTNCEGLDESYFERFEESVDCLILDKEIDSNLKRKIRERFNKIPTIFLPSLEIEQDNGNGKRNMSEPLRLSELHAVLNDISSGLEK